MSEAPRSNSTASVVEAAEGAEPRDDSTRFAARLVCMAVGVAIALKVGLIVDYAKHMRWVMDEFAQGYGGNFVEVGLYSHVDPIKTALPQLAFYAAIATGRSAVEVLSLLRAETAAAALLTVLATGFVAQRMHRNVLWTLLSVFTLLCFSNYLERSYRVRNDSFAVLFAIVSLAVMLGSERPRWSSFGSGLLAGGAFLCTQKAVYQVAGLFCGLVVLAWRTAGPRFALVQVVRYGAGIALALALYAVALGGVDAGRVIAAVFLSPLEWKANVLSSEAFSEELGRFVVRTLNRNAIAYLLCAVGIATTLVTAKKRTPAQVAAAVTSVVCTVTVFSHPQPWPYVFVACMPFIALFAPVCLEFVQARRRPMHALALAALLSLSFVRNFTVMALDNAEQLRVVREAEAMLGPNDRYFDGIAMVPTRTIAGAQPWWWWDGPMTAALRKQLEAGDRQNFDTIIGDRPKLWIVNYRFHPLAKWLAPIVESATVRVADLIYVSGRSLAPGHTVRFRNLWPGAYHVVDADGRPSAATAVVDGRPCPAPCRIAVGEHQVSASAEHEVFLLPTDVAPPGPLPVRSVFFEPFEGIYDF